MLSNWLTDLDTVIPGTLRTVYLKCGKTECKCRSGNEADKHGPYHFWDRKVDGKLTSSSIPLKELKKFRQWIKNRERLDELVRRVKVQGEQSAVKFIQRSKSTPSD